MKLLKNVLLHMHTIIVTLLMACNFAQAKTVIEKPFMYRRIERTCKTPYLRRFG